MREIDAETMRAWLSNDVPTREVPVDVECLTDEQVLEEIDGLYDGGVAGFVADSRD